MEYYQQEIALPPFKRGFHLITPIIEKNFRALQKLEIGMLNIFIKHTSASLTINENADPTVRMDFESHFNHMVPENAPYYRHTFEGPDDMPAHLKAAILGNSLHIPLSKGKMNLGTWQGIYLCEHRDYGGPRRIVLTAYGKTN